MIRPVGPDHAHAAWTRKQVFQFLLMIPRRETSFSTLRGSRSAFVSPLEGGGELLGKGGDEFALIVQ